MENKMKTADQIVRMLANGEEPLDGDDDCTACPIENVEGWGYAPLAEGPDGHSVAKHHPRCPWRLAVEYVKAAERFPGGEYCKHCGARGEERAAIVHREGCRNPERK